LAIVSPVVPVLGKRRCKELSRAEIVRIGRSSRSRVIFELFACVVRKERHAVARKGISELQLTSRLGQRAMG